MKILATIIATALSFQAYSADSLNAKVSGSYSSIRALGMGNAFTAVADDYSLIMYNPAGFARKKHNEFQWTLLGAGVSSKTMTIANDIDKASKTGTTDADKANAISNVLQNYYGQSLGGKLQAFELFWIRNGWGVALLPFDMTIDMAIQKQLGPALDLTVRGDSSAAMGFGKEVNKYIDAGITLKYIHRVAVEEVVSAFELASDPNVLSEKRFKEGTLADFDIGFMWRPNWFNTKKEVIEEKKPESSVDAAKKEEPKPEAQTKGEPPSKDEPSKDEPKSEETRQPQSEGEAKEVKVAEEPKSGDEIKPAEGPAAAAAVAEKPSSSDATVSEKKVVESSVPESEESFPLTFGFVVHNVIGGEFKLAKDVNKNATETPRKLYRMIDIGSQYLLREGEDFKIRVMLDFQNLLHPEVDLNKSLHAGIEFDYSPSTWFKTQLRAGVNQMYFTAGASFLFGVFNIEAVTYGEEVGTADAKLENRVLAAKLGFNF